MNTLQSIGGAALPIHGDETHVRQRPGPEAHWQDSVVLVWWDDTHRIGGFHRIGHEPNTASGPMIALWNNLITPEGVYRKTVYQPLREADRLASGGHGGGDDTCRCEYLNGEHVWTLHDGEVSAELRHSDFSPNVDCYPKQGAIGDDFAPAHFDVPGRVTGWLKVNGTEYQVQGLSVRDHGWGPRDWNSVYSHRWVAGTTGPDFGFIGVSWHAANDSMASFGWVVRGERVTYAKKLDILTYTEIDGATNRGGRVRFELADGQTIDIECTAVAPGLISTHHDICCTDTLCRITVDGQPGFCDFESSSNMQHGKRVPAKAVGLVDNGFHPNPVQA